MKKIFIQNVIILTLLSAFNLSFAQGLNNNYDIDQQDLKQVMSMQGIDIFKFPFKSIDTTKHINVIIKEYDNGKLTDSANIAQSYSEMIKKYGMDILPSLKKGEDNKLRFYFYRKDNDIHLNLSLNGNSQELAFTYSKDITQFGSRAFDIDYDGLSGRERILAYYGRKESPEEMHCAMNDSDETLAKRFDKVITVYIEEAGKVQAPK